MRNEHRSVKEARKKNRTGGVAPTRKRARQIAGSARGGAPARLQPIVEANQLLAEAGIRLENASGYDAQLNVLAGMCVPRLSDWCALHVLGADGSVEQVAVATAETADMDSARTWLNEHLPADEVRGLPAVLRSGAPLLVGDSVTDAAVSIARRALPSKSAAAAGVRSYLMLPLSSRRPVMGALTLVLAGSRRRFDVDALAVASNLANHVAANLYRFRLDRESQGLNAELEQRVSARTAALRMAVGQLQQSKAAVQTLFHISEKLNATLNVERLLDILAQEAIQMVNGEAGFAGLRADEGMRMRKYFRHGEAIPFEHTWRAGEGIPGWVLQHRLPYSSKDASNDPNMQHDLPINHGVRSVICTPILDSAGEVLGFIDIRDKQNGAGFTVADQETLLALSSIAAIAMQHALAYEQRVQAEIELSYSNERLRALAARIEEVREEERTEIARELHDQLGQALTALKLDLAQLTKRLVQKDATLAREAKVTTAQIDGLVKTARRIATDLRPGVLDNLGLAASLEWQAREFRRRTGIDCMVSAPEQLLPLTPAQRTALFRVCQEALTNVARHAQARHVYLELMPANEGVTLRVRDDGRGIRHAEVTGAESLGLLGMRERATLLGGTFGIQGEAGKGTTITVTMPYVAVS